MEPPGMHYIVIVKKVIKGEEVFCPLCDYRRDIDVHLLKIAGNVILVQCRGGDHHVFWATKDEIKRG